MLFLRVVASNSKKVSWIMSLSRGLKHSSWTLPFKNFILLVMPQRKKSNLSKKRWECKEDGPTIRWAKMQGAKSFPIALVLDGIIHSSTNAKILWNLCPSRSSCSAFSRREEKVRNGKKAKETGGFWCKVCWASKSPRRKIAIRNREGCQRKNCKTGGKRFYEFSPLDWHS